MSPNFTRTRNKLQNELSRVFKPIKGSNQGSSASTATLPIHDFGISCPKSPRQSEKLPRSIMEYYSSVGTQRYYKAKPAHLQSYSDMTDVLRNRKVSQKYEPQSAMRKETFEDTHFYLGYSSMKRDQLGRSLNFKRNA